MALKRVPSREPIPLIFQYSYMHLGKTPLPTRDHEPATQIKRWAFSCTNYVTTCKGLFFFFVYFTATREQVLNHMSLGFFYFFYT